MPNSPEHLRAAQGEETMGLIASMTHRMTQGQIIDACRQGDREAFRQLYDLYKDRVYTIALHFFHGDESLAEDVVQEVFLRLHTRIRQFHGRSEFTTWLYRLVRNVCIDEHRRRKRWVSMDEEGGEPSAGGGDCYSKVELSLAVQDALRDLKPEMRMAVLLRYFEDLSYDEMAEALGCTKGTVASRLNRCHKLLAKKLSPFRSPNATEGRDV
jgi:RNA polymerase sigma-70 factor, ECF subfamily